MAKWTRIALGVGIVLLGFLYGFLVGDRRLPPYDSLIHVYEAAYTIWSAPPEEGRWRAQLQRSVAAADTKESELELIADLEAVGYAGGFHPPPAESAVTLHDEARAFHGVNLVLSGHGPEAELIDMKGQVLHSWRYAYERAYPGRHVKSDFDWWRRAHLYENGDIVVIAGQAGLIKLDRDSNVVWISPENAHHDLDVTADGSIYVLTRRPNVIPEIDEREPVLEDYVAILDAEGRTQKEVSVYQALKDSIYSGLLHQTDPDASTPPGDIHHTNTLSVLDGSLSHLSPHYRAGNVLISMYVQNAIAILDMDREMIVWALSGIWRLQHDPVLLENGNMMLFDNWGDGGTSRVIELDPFTQEIAWVYDGDEHGGLFSNTCGAVQRLDNGNTVVTESDNGRVIELNPAGEIVWEFRNPRRGGTNDMFIATIFDCVRLSPDFPLDWTHHTR